MSNSWSNLAKVVYKRTYSRKIEGTENTENWSDTVNRVIEGNIGKYRGTTFLEDGEEERLRYFMENRKALPGGRGLWFSGTKAQEVLGGCGLNNCYFFTADSYENFYLAQDLLMLGGGIGLSVEHRFVSKLPKVKKNVVILNKDTKDADFIVPDSREGWVRLLKKVLKSYFETGESFTYSTIVVRGHGEPIKGFGGVASGPIPLIKCVDKLTSLLVSRAGKSIRPVDAMDIMCIIGEMVVAGNVRRSAILIQGDCWDKEYLKSKRWDLGEVPTQRAMANLSVICDDIEDLHPAFWETYREGEPFGIINRTNMQKYGRIGELKKDAALGTNPCGEITLADSEPCNLTDIFLPNLTDEKEFYESARLMYRWAKRVTNESYHQPKTDAIVKKNRRVGVGITGCLQSSLFTPEILDKAYKIIKEEDKKYSELNNIPESIRLTTIKPSGTVSLLADTTPGIHPAYSKYYIRRVRFSSDDPLIPLLKEAGHVVEAVKKFDGSLDYGTLVVEFPCETSPDTPTADEDWDTWKQLEVLKMVQKYWSDNSVSVTVYYKKEDINLLQDWLKENISSIKTISFLAHNEHGFDQAPYEAITEEQYKRLIQNIKPVDTENIGEAQDVELNDCAGGVCPIK